MKAIQKVYISGLGAVGGAYATRLYDMDPSCIKVIADKGRIKRYAKDGIIINGKAYPFEYIHPGEDAEPADLILIVVKYHHLEQILKDIGRFVGRDTIILSLLNGISSEEVVGSVYGMDRLLYSYVVGIDAVRTGTSIQFSSIGKIVFGEKSNDSYSPKVTAVKELFDRAGIPYSIPENMIRSMWWKFMINVGVNQVSAILKAPYGAFLRIKEAWELMEMAALEVVSLSKKAGANLEKSELDEFVNILRSMDPEGKTSMLQDIEAGRKTEVDIFAGAVIKLGRKYDEETPVNEMLYRMIRALEQMDQKEI